MFWVYGLNVQRYNLHRNWGGPCGHWDCSTLGWHASGSIPLARCSHEVEYSQPSYLPTHARDIYLFGSFTLPSLCFSFLPWQMASTVLWVAIESPMDLYFLLNTLSLFQIWHNKKIDIQTLSGTYNFQIYIIQTEQPFPQTLFIGC